jgi:hypothetical protein
MMIVFLKNKFNKSRSTPSVDCLKISVLRVFGSRQDCLLPVDDSLPVSEGGKIGVS